MNTNWPFNVQVDLDDGRASKIQDKDGMISKDDFTQFAKDTHLLDVDSALGEAMLLLSPKKMRKQSQTPKKKSIKKSEENKDDKVCWNTI